MYMNIHVLFDGVLNNRNLLVLVNNPECLDSQYSLSRDVCEKQRRGVSTQKSSF